MTVEDFVGVVREVFDDLQREEEQSILQRDMHKAEMALAGKMACSRILRSVESRAGIHVAGVRRVGRAR